MKTYRLAAALSLCLCASLAHAQQPNVIVSGIVSSATLDQGLPYSTIAITGGVQRFTGADGSFSFSLPPGTYSFRVRQLGYSPLDTTIVVAPAASLRALVFKLQPVAFRLDAVRTYATTCSAGYTGGVGVLVDELTKNAEREKLLRTEYPFVYEMERVTSTSGIGGITQTATDTISYQSKVIEGYRPGKLVRPVDSMAPKGDREMRIPTLTDLADPVFLGSHCFRLAGVESVGSYRTYRIDFEPSKEIDAPDVEGSAFIDTTSFLIRQAIFRLTKPNKLKPPTLGLEVTTLYREIFNGLALFEQIHAEQPLVASKKFKATRLEDQKLNAIKFYGRTPADVVISEAPKPARSLPDTMPRLAGIVVDSSGRPLAHATIMTADRSLSTTSSDSGRFLLKGLKPGRNQFLVRALGYAPAIFMTQLRAGRTRQVRVVLSPTTVQLSTITVLDSISDPLLSKTGFYERARHGMGTFFTPQQIAKRNPSRASDMLRTASGVDVQVDPRTGGSIPLSRRAKPGRCVMALYIDGVKTELGSRGGMTTTLEDVISGFELGAMEVYPGPAETPPEYMGGINACGTIVIWTKGWLSEENAPDSSSNK